MKTDVSWAMSASALHALISWTPLCCFPSSMTIASFVKVEMNASLFLELMASRQASMTSGIVVWRDMVKGELSVVAEFVDTW